MQDGLTDKLLEISKKEEELKGKEVAVAKEKDVQKKQVDTIRARESVLASKEKKIDVIITKLKKEKALENDLKSVGL